MEDKKQLSENHGRFKDADWYGQSLDIVIGGAGGIGSWLAMFLTRIGHKLYIFDDDTIDITNMGGQLYKQSQIGLNKAEAVKQNVLDFNGTDLVDCFMRYDEKMPMVSPIMVTCFDNMAGRKLMFENWCKQEDRELFVDGRMLAETGMVFFVQKGQEDLYKSELFEDSEVNEAPCSFKATSHCGALIGSLMTNGINSYLGNKSTGVNIRILPFRYDFELPLFNFNDIESDGINRNNNT